MTTYTIENETNNITAHATKQEAKAVPNSECFNSAEQLAKLASAWPTARLVEIWNGVPGVTRLTNFKDRAAAAARIWKAIQSLGESLPAEAAAQPGQISGKEPKAKRKQPQHEVSRQEPVSKDVQPERAANDVDANPGTESPNVAAADEKATKKAAGETKGRTRETGAGAKAPREGSKTDQVIAMLKAEGGTTLEAIMAAMGWQKHTTRAMLSAGGSLTKKHELVVTSEKVSGGMRVYSIKA